MISYRRWVNAGDILLTEAGCKWFLLNCGFILCVSLGGVCTCIGLWLVIINNESKYFWMGHSCNNTNLNTIQTSSVSTDNSASSLNCLVCSSPSHNIVLEQIVERLMVIFYLISLYIISLLSHKRWVFGCLLSNFSLPVWCFTLKTVYIKLLK